MLVYLFERVIEHHHLQVIQQVLKYTLPVEFLFIHHALLVINPSGSRGPTVLTIGIRYSIVYFLVTKLSNMKTYLHQEFLKCFQNLIN